MIAALILLSGCGGAGGAPHAAAGGTGQSLRAVMGPSGGALSGEAGSPFEGVQLIIPAGALAAEQEIRIEQGGDPAALPPTAVACGPRFAVEPAGLQLAMPATLTLPVDESIAAANYELPEEVKVWARGPAGWDQRPQVDSTDGTVTVELEALTTVSAGVNPAPEKDLVQFDLHPNPKFLRCLAAAPDDPHHAPRAHIVVRRGKLNDALFLHAINLKPGLAFDLFTIEHSSLDAKGAPDPSFKNFGLAWYQTDVETSSTGQAGATIHTILLDQIFGFDAATGLPPTGTFHVGFWFNQPEDAAPCGFDVAHPTPFNGEHRAGPLAMITVPDGSSGLGPLCTKPDTSVSPARCSP